MATSFELLRSALRRHREQVGDLDPAVACPKCNGSGMDVVWKECIVCCGDGVVRRSLSRVVRQFMGKL